jgi:PAS domain S-box-containing protein
MTALLRPTLPEPWGHDHPRMRILIADDHEIIRRGVRSLLEARPNYDICGEAVDGKDAVEKASKLKPDLVIMDVSMPGLNGLEATRSIRKQVPKTEVIILTQHESEEMMRQAAHAGAHGYVVKSAIARDLVLALESIRDGEFFIHRKLPAAAKSAPHIEPQEILRRGAALEQQLRDSEERYRALVMASARSVWRCDSEGKHIERSEKWTSIDESDIEVGEGEDWLQRIHPDDRERVLQAWQESLRTGEPYFQEARRLVNGAYRYLETRAVPIRRADGSIREWIGASVDISKRKQAEAEVRASQERIALAHSAAGIGTWQYDLKNRSYNWSAQTFSNFGIDPSDPNYYDSWFSRIHVEDQARVEAMMEHGMNQESAEVEYRYHHPKGETRWIFSKGRALPSAIGDSCMFGISVDNTRRKQIEQDLRNAQAELEKRVEERTRELILAMSELQAEVQMRTQTESVMRELSGKLLRLQDEERRRIARELHDSTGQTLTALKMNLAALQSTLTSGTGSEQLIQDTEALADQALSEIRTTSYLLHPPLLDEAGFTSAARWFVDGLATRSQLKVNLDIAPQLGRLPADVELTLFRVLQEALTNILRHSGSETADVQVQRPDGSVMLIIQDYGSGIPADTLTQRRIGNGVGLAGMRERVTELGGQFNISSSSGTKVTVSIPIPGTPQETRMRGSVPPVKSEASAGRARLPASTSN